MSKPDVIEIDTPLYFNMIDVASIAKSIVRDHGDTFEFLKPLQEALKLLEDENSPLNRYDITFDEAWSEKEAAGYQYGRDALEQVRFGWEIRESYIASRKCALCESIMTHSGACSDCVSGITDRVRSSQIINERK